jgi:hypothetical protein
VLNRGTSKAKAYSNLPGVERVMVAGEAPGSSGSPTGRTSRARRHEASSQAGHVAGSPHPVFGGATNSENKKLQWVRPIMRHRNVQRTSAGARGPFGRADGVPDGGTHENHVGEMLRIASLPRNGLTTSPSRRKPELKSIIAPNGKVLLVRNRKGRVAKERSAADIKQRSINVSELDAKDLFGSYERLREKKEEYIQKAAAEDDGEFDYIIPGYRSLDGGDSFLSKGSALSAGMSFTQSSLDEPATSKLLRAEEPKLTPLSIDGKRDLLDLIVEKTAKPYHNPNMCMTERIALLQPNAPDDH